MESAATSGPLTPDASSLHSPRVGPRTAPATIRAAVRACGIHITADEVDLAISALRLLHLPGMGEESAKTRRAART